ncbi:phosphoglycerate dehydrogenase [candidate division KSB1 bacterium]|nr:MAG: phosphoglycerate dehydrogenase [candidate division KSB1 bacterium]MBC6946640.1 phosphoglycerate dehydrogenase [candidate division KSB1 bacterium]MCE7940628.1 phosphoglycerate dehydrogenase [Chlorobi bacterium CHB1]MDL1873606.1 phosphoglycerate dehydrogenase [Cytophagia bacterium CHB2]
MKNNTPIAVTSRSFSQHPILRAELLQRYSNVRFNDEGLSLHGNELIAFAQGRRKLITALERIDESILAALPELEVISKYGVGTDMLDKQAMARRGIRLGWTGGVNKRSVAELAIAFMIALLRHVPLTNQEIRDGIWKNRQGKQLTGRTVGIIGCGHVGKDLTLLLRAFNCQVLAHDILDFPEFYAANQVEPVGLEELLRRSEIVTLHVPLDGSTRNMLSAERLALMKPEAVLINTARGGIVDETALKQMLIEGQLAAAGFDVFATEPPSDLELLRLPNFLATPHLGGSSAEAVLAMGRAAIAGLDENEIPIAD